MGLAGYLSADPAIILLPCRRVPKGLEVASPHFVNFLCYSVGSQIMSNNKKLGSVVKRGAVVSSGIQVFSIVADLIVMAVMARLLDPVDYGIFAAGMLFIAICDLLREIGIGVTIIQMPKLSVNDQRTAFTLVLMVALLAFGASQLGAGLFADFMGMTELENVIKVLAFGVLIQAFGNISQGLLLRDMRVVHITIIEFVTRLVSSLLVGIGLALAGFGYWSLVAASLTEMLLRSIALVVLAKPPLKPQLERDSARRLLGRGSGFALSRIIAFVSQKADVTIIGRYQDAASLGIYSRAIKLMNLPTTLYGKVADRVVFPAMAKVQDEPARLKSAYLRGTEVTAVIGIPLTVCLYLLAPEIIGVLMGEKWLGVIPVFAVVAFGMYFRLSGRVGGSVLRATAAIRSLVLTQATNAIIIIIGTLWVVDQGTVAVAWVVTGATAIWYAQMSIRACHLVNVSMGEFLRSQYHGFILGLVCGLPLAGAAWLLRNYEFNAIVILLLSGFILGIIGVMLIATSPRWCLGGEAATMATAIRKQVLKKIGRAST